MKFFKKKPTQTLEQQLNESEDSQGTSLKMSENIDIHVMPDKFFGVKPSHKEPISASSKPEENKAELDKPKMTGLKRNIVIGAAVIVVVGAAMGVGAYLLIKSFNKQPEPIVPTTPTRPTTPTQPTTPTEPVEPTEPTEPVAPTEPTETIDDVPPEIISFDIDRPVSENGFVLSWSAADNEALQFVVLRRTTDSLGTPIPSGWTEVDRKVVTGSSVSGFFNNDPQTDGVWWYSVVAIDLAGNISLDSSPISGTKRGEVVVNPPTTVPQDTDDDRDLLTAAEESLFGTNPQLVDTDGDSYQDGFEILNLFDPQFGGGALLANSNNITVFIEQSLGYRMFIPDAWSEERISSTATRFVPLTSGSQISQEYFEVIVEDNTLDVSDARSWYISQFPGSNSGQLIDVTAQGIRGVMSPDGLTAYFVSGNSVYSITYNPATTSGLKYLTTFRMVVASFSVFENPITF